MMHQWRGDEQSRVQKRLEQESRSGKLRNQWEAERMRQESPHGLLRRLWRAVRGRGAG